MHTGSQGLEGLEPGVVLKLPEDAEGKESSASRPATVAHRHSPGKPQRSHRHSAGRGGCSSLHGGSLAQEVGAPEGGNGADNAKPLTT